MLLYSSPLRPLLEGGCARGLCLLNLVVEREACLVCCVNVCLWSCASLLCFLFRFDFEDRVGVITDSDTSTIILYRVRVGTAPGTWSMESEKRKDKSELSLRCHPPRARRVSRRRPAPPLSPLSRLALGLSV